MNNSWTQKYSPRSASEITGQREVLGYVKNFVKSFPRTRKKAILLYGPTGTGKTAIPKALANEMDLELVELNASDWRDAATIESVLGAATRQASLFATRKLILVDEVDSTSGQQDRGGVAAITDVIKNSAFPVILTANDVWSEKLKTLRMNCELMELKPLTSLAILEKLKDICAKENIKYELAALQKLATSANGDLRAAINDLQMFADKDRDLTEKEIQLWGREKEESIFALLKLIFKSFNVKAMRKVSDYVDEELDTLMLWLDQNIPAEYQRPAEFAFAYRNLAAADIFLSRIRRRQHWRFLVYAYYLALVGVQQAKLEINRRFIVHQRPELLLKLFIRAAKRKKMRSLAEEFAATMHTSGYRLQTAFWPYYSFVAEKGKSFAGLELE